MATVGLFGALCYHFFLAAPSHVDQPATLVVDSGQGVRSITNELKSLGVVRSAKVAQTLIVLLGGERRINAGMYVFESPQNVLTVVSRILRGNYGYTPVKLTVPEGTSSSKLAALVSEKFPHIDRASFEAMAKAKEGFLFPETYFFAPITTPELIIEHMEKTFDNKLAEHREKILAFAATKGMSFEDMIIVASILEGEVQTAKDRRMVADLLYRRLAQGMLLQVDTTLVYVTGRGSSELTVDDLKSNSPYNTYVNKGLPPTPISNPGLDTILAAIEPEANPYLFYLSDKDGITHFARTHDEHVKLKAKYLR